MTIKVSFQPNTNFGDKRPDSIEEPDIQPGEERKIGDLVKVSRNNPARGGSVIVRCLGDNSGGEVTQEAPIGGGANTTYLNASTPVLSRVLFELTGYQPRMAGILTLRYIGPDETDGALLEHAVPPDTLSAQADKPD